MKRRTSLLLRFGGIAVVLLIVANFALSRLFASDTLAEAIPVELEEAVTATMHTRVVGSCTFRARRSVQVISDVGGRVIAIPVQVGDVVTAGQTLVEFDRDALQNALLQADVSLRETELSLAHNLANLRATIVSSERAWNSRLGSLERNRTLRRTGTVSDDTLISAEEAEREAFDALRSAREQLNLAASLPVQAEPPMDAAGDARIIADDPGVIQARLAAERAAEELEQATVVAPLDGTVTTLDATLGNHTGAWQPVATVETLDHILAGVQIDEVDIGKIRVGQNVILTTETLRDVEVLGTIRLVPPTMSQTGSVPLVTIEVDVDQNSLPEGARLLAGSSCRARIDAELKQDATALPYAALVEQGGATIAFVAGPIEGEESLYRLERREVKIGVSTPSQVEVTDGVEVGELVVVGNLSLLRDGLSVMVREEPPEEDAEPEPETEQQPDATAEETPQEAPPAEEAPAEQP